MDRGGGIALALLAGGLVGAVARPAVVYAFWLRGADADMSLVLLLVSAGIGLIVGIVAVLIGGLIRTTLLGSLVGAISGAALAYLATILTFLPLLWCGLLNFNGVRAVGDEAPLYGVAMALTGALSGGTGSFLRGWLGGQRPNTPSKP